jgi:DNA-binding transcriptional MerR regulator
MKEKKYFIQELSDLTGFTRRTIRYYIQEGLLEPPAGRGRGGFYYDSHLQRLLYIKSMQNRGLSLYAIREMEGKSSQSFKDEQEIWVRHKIHPGLEINVAHSLEKRELKKINEIIEIAKAILKEK